MRRFLSTAACPAGVALSGSKRACKLFDVGRVPYMQAWAMQKAYVDERLRNEQADLGDAVIFVEHDAVYTVGRGGSLSNVKFNTAEPSAGPQCIRVDRGGEVTYHGPGQLVVYPLFALGNFKKDIRWFVCRVEDVVIQTLKHYGLEGHRVTVREPSFAAGTT